MLIMRRQSGPYITGELVISEGTFKTHCHHIYRKLGIHKNQELLNLVSEDDPQNKNVNGNDDATARMPRGGGDVNFDQSNHIKLAGY
jgi:hypothetical protein